MNGGGMNGFLHLILVPKSTVSSLNIDQNTLFLYIASSATLHLTIRANAETT